nr:protein ovarian tumor locus [Drosophila bipectinata]
MDRRVRLGSRDQMHPIDKFLENYLLFRKHTVKDSSNLFRVVAEQLYDTQMLHYEIRMECVRFMFRKRRFFEPLIQGDFDEYLSHLQNAQKKGTMLELRALCHLYKRNVAWYTPFELGKVIVFHKNYTEKFWIFSDGQGNFDSVISMTEVSAAAVCQAIAYKLLYKMLFCLPDVNLAVEMMLYPQTFENGIKIEIDNIEGVIRMLCSNGRSFKLDRPENTVCLLADYRRCTFHYRYWENLNSLHEDNLSCVRLILKNNRLPFSYSIAKSMDPFIYRNVELKFSRELKYLNVYTGDYNFKVGAKCHVDLDTDELGEMSICHIQAINRDKTLCVVFVESLGRTLTVPYETLHPLPPGQFKPWPRPQNLVRSQVRRENTPQRTPIVNPMSRIIQRSVINAPEPSTDPIAPAESLQISEIDAPSHQLPPIQENVFVPQPNTPTHQMVPVHMPPTGCYPGPTPNHMHSGINHNNQPMVPGPVFHPPFPGHYVIRPPVPYAFYPSTGVGPQTVLVPYPNNVATPSHNDVPANPTFFTENN